MDISALQNLLKKNTISKDDFKTGFKSVQQDGSYSDVSIFKSEYTDGDLDTLFANFDKNNDGIIDKKDKLNNKSLSEDIMSEDDLDLLIDELNEMFAQLDGVDAASLAGGSGGISSSGGATGSIGQTSSDSSDNNEDYSSKSADEIEKELETAKSDLATKQEALNSIIDGTDSTLNTKQEEITTKEKQYQELLSNIAPKLAQEYGAAKNDLDTHNQAIADTTVKINQTQANIDSLNASISSLKGQIDGYDASIESLKKLEGTENAPTDLSSKISSLESKKNQAEEAKKAKEGELKTAKEELSNYQNTLNELESQTAQKEEALQTIQDKIDKLNNDELTNLKKEIDGLKTTFENDKTDMQTKAQSAVDSAKETVNELQKAYDDKKAQEIKNEGTAYNAKGLYDALGLEKEGLSFENFNFMFEGYNKLEDKGTGRISVVDEVNHNCYVIDMNSKTLVGKYKVSTGHNVTDLDKANMANSYKATPGGWLKISGVHYGNKYRGNAMHLVGLESCNDNTSARGVIAHQISYSIGYNTWGCLGFQESVSTIKNEIMRDGGLVFVIKKGMIDDNSKYRKQSEYYSI